MYAYNRIAKRRPKGWVERRRYFKRVLARTSPPPVKDDKKRHVS